MLDFEFAPYDPAFFRDPYPKYAKMRADCAVHHWTKADVWTVCRYSEASDVLRDHRNFSSRPAGEAFLKKLPGNRWDDPAEVNPATRDQLRGLLVAADPPVHRDLRKSVARAFAPRIIEILRDDTQILVDGIIAELVQRPSFDAVEDFATVVPVSVACKMLAIDQSQVPNLCGWSSVISRGLTGSIRESDHRESGLFDAHLGIQRVIRGSIAQGKSSDPNSVLAHLLTAFYAGELSRRETIGFASLIFFAGVEATRALIGNCIMHLLENPDLLEQVCQDAEAVPLLVEEILRWNSPSQFAFRRAINDTEIGGITIPRGADICVVLGSANRDPDYWGVDAENFKLGRNARPHLDFGVGIHTCLGASLVRTEATIAMTAILPVLRERVAKYQSDVTFDSAHIRGYQHIWLNTRETVSAQ